ncbi:DNA gyrase subunit A [Buchnera aphidicola (Taiwanaphis decaspermi)]|uniref:DNA gyrase subunit A n=1 Tax=Buchnera aphidicola TaxID=9 RepID=UPI0031B87093
MKNFSKEIIKLNIEKELKRSYLDYSMSVIIGRALPDVRDGLKPVHRRILFAMYILKNFWNKPYKKSARIVGDVIGKYHPHGDSAVYDTIVRMAQSFSLRYTLIEGQGNFGSVDGDSAAAMRYTEIRMSKISNEMMFDLEKKTVDFINNYDGSYKIPEILPTRIPNILINGSSGIAVGMATNVPPHNLTEVINGCIALIKNKKINILELMKYIPGPDFPTGGIINGISGILNAYKTGKGKIYIRSCHKITKNKKTKKTSIIIYEIPYQINKAKLIEKIANLIKEKKIEGISSLRDESDKEGMRIVIEIKKEAIAEIILNKLYLLTQLQISFGINMVALDKGQPKVMPLKKILKSFIFHRKEIVIRRTIYDLSKTRKKTHIIEGLIIALQNIKLIISAIQKIKKNTTPKKIILSSPWNIKDNYFNKLINNNKKIINIKIKTKSNKYYFTKKQVESILNLKLQKINNLEKDKLIKKYKKLIFKINNFLKILKNKKYMLNIIKKELKLIRKQFHDKRKTKITKNKSNINIEDMIDKTDVVVTLSNLGYVKYQPISDYVAQKRGGKGKSAVNIKEEDFIHCILVTNTHDNILCFSSKGILYWMKVYQLPKASRFSRGKPIVNLIPLNINERITAILPIPKFPNDVNIVMSTSNGIIKKTSLSEFSRPRNSGIIAINLRKDDELIGVALTNGNDNIMLFTSSGKAVRFHEKSLRNMGRNAAGVKGIKISKTDKVVSLIIPKNNGHILTVTQNGFGKRTKLKEYPLKSRATKGVIAIKVTKKVGIMIGAVQVIEKDQIIMITNAGTLVRTRVSEVVILKRNTQGVILIRTSDKEQVVGLQRVDESRLENKFKKLKKNNK